MTISKMDVIYLSLQELSLLARFLLCCITLINE